MKIIGEVIESKSVRKFRRLKPVNRPLESDLKLFEVFIHNSLAQELQKKSAKNIPFN